MSVTDENYEKDRTEGVLRHEEFMELPPLPVEQDGPVKRQSDYRYELAGYYIDMNREDFTFEHIKRCWKRGE